MPPLPRERWTYVRVCVCEYKSIRRVGVRSCLPQSSQEDDNLETTFMYRNTNYRDSCNSSSSSTVLQDNANDKCVFFRQTIESMEDEEDVTQRPVSCPIAECSKRLTTNSIFSHFHFEHPKTPIINLDRSITLSFKMNGLASEKTCLAVLLPSASKNRHCNLCCDGVECTTTHYKKTHPLLLMAVRMAYLLHDLNSGCNKGKSEICPIEEKVNIEKYEIEENNETQSNISNYALLLWLCSIDNDESVYAITVTSEGNKFSKNCIGPAFNLRDGDVSAIQLSEALVVQAAAVNLLCQKQDHIVVVVQALID
ncbi:hypothetical protein EVAR_67378_1 [Eumeta japonica]|uniref:DUF4729 domain-containing protein n=1 Tax=Eumeta variegata TaxID=151549 RepID=A0A4C2AFQ3_EUMVA|nr:hypothetical protein EVAR_67378_1 [Eumeta japonica]